MPDRVSSQHLVLFACCLPVRGERRSTICDLQNERFVFIPNALCDVLARHSALDVEAWKREHDHEHDDVIDEYVVFLIKNEFAFWTDEPERFPPLDLTWETPHVITNGIIDVDAASDHDVARIFAEYDAVGCQAVQIRVFDSRPPEEISKLIAPADRSGIRSIDVLMADHPAATLDALGDLCAAHPRIASIFVHSAKRYQEASVQHNGAPVPVIFRTDAVTDETHCGQVHPAYFVTNFETFLESTSFNSCLNRKLSVDRRGRVRQCPSMPGDFGDHRSVSFRAVALRDDFQEVWAVTKDQIEGCRTCEFRHVCTDCRAYVREPGNRYSKPASCTYDPVTATWEEAPPPHVSASIVRDGTGSTMSNSSPSVGEATADSSAGTQA